MQLTIRSITRGVLYGALPGAAVLSMALLSGSAWAQSSSGSSGSSGASGSSGSSQSSGSQSSSRQSQTEDDDSSDTRSQSQRSRTNRQSDDPSDEFDSSQRQRSSSGLGQSNRDRDSDTTSNQQRRSSSQRNQNYQDEDQNGQSSQRSRGLGQSNRDRSDDDYSSQRNRNQSYDQDQYDDGQSYSQSDRQRSSSQQREGSMRSSNQAQLGVSFSSSSNGGLVISNVNPQSIAAQSGLRSGDQLVSINGRRIQSREQFTDWINSAQGRRLSVVVRRNGREVPVTLAMQDRNWQTQGYAQDDPEYSRDSDYGSRASLGVLLDPRYQQGAMVDRVYRDSPAEEAGLQRGDYIISVDGQRINSPQDLVRVISRMDPGSDVEIEYTRRQRDTAYVSLGSQGQRQDSSSSLTQERRSSGNQRSASRQQYDESDEFRD